MSIFLRSGATFRVRTEEALDIHKTLPAGNYTIGKDLGGLYLERIDAFEIHGKIYGNTVRNAGRILATFKDRPSSTGVMLTGEKGSGKTMLAKMLSIDGAKEGMPTIVINAPWTGDEFYSLLQQITQPCIILFDEFEKVYDREKQEEILTLLDGVFPSKKLFVLTCNDKYRVDVHMRNRPGRIFYMLDFKGLEHDFIVEYCKDNLKSEQHIPAICKIASMFGEFNFDMLKALIEEMNRYGETPQEALTMLNAKPEFGNEQVYTVQLQIGGVDLPEGMADAQWHGNPLGTGRISVDWKKMNGEKAAIASTRARIEPALVGSDTDDDDWEWESALFESGDLKHIDAAAGKFTFLNEQGERLVLTKVKAKAWKYPDAF